MTQVPEWTYQHIKQMRDHWWWRPGWDLGKRFYTWHLTFDGDTQLHQLVDAYQRELAAQPGLDLVPRRWLHLTMQGLGFTDQVETRDVERVIYSATERLAQHPSARVAFHRPVIRPEAIALPPQPLVPITEIRDTIRSAMADTLGEGTMPEQAGGFQPHVSLAYSNGDRPTPQLIDILSATRTAPARVTVSQASLIKLNRDHRMYEWQTIAVARLAPGHADSSNDIPPSSE